MEIFTYTVIRTEGKRSHLPFQMQPEEHEHGLSPQPPLQRERTLLVKHWKQHKHDIIMSWILVHLHFLNWYYLHLHLQFKRRTWGPTDLSASPQSLGTRCNSSSWKPLPGTWRRRKPSVVDSMGSQSPGLTNLISFHNEMTSLMDERRAVHTVLQDFGKAFDSVLRSS